MAYRFETFRNNKGIVVLQSLKVSHLYLIPNRFYNSPKLKNWMCELCTFSQIRSHIVTLLLSKVMIPLLNFTFYASFWHKNAKHCNYLINTLHALKGLARRI